MSLLMRHMIYMPAAVHILYDMNINHTNNTNTIYIMILLFKLIININFYDSITNISTTIAKA